MKKFLKPGLSIILIVVFALCTPIFSSAKTNAFLPNDNLIIPEPAAIKFAEYFVRDMVLSKQTKWNSDVHVVDVVPTYDETGEKLTSYFVELSKGYVTISAYIDMPNLVLEWSDELKPSYHNFGERNNAKIIYTGPMDIYLDDGTSQVKSIDGERISRNKISDKISALRNEQNIPLDFKKKLAYDFNIQNKKNSQIILNSNNAPDNSIGGYITNAGVYLENTQIIWGKWVCTDWTNNWENYANFAVGSSMSIDSTPCGPVTITNAIKMYGNKYNISSIKSSTNKSIFNIVAELGRNKGYYTMLYGTPSATADDYIRESFSEFGKNIYTYGPYYCTIQNIKNASTANRLMYIMLVDNNTYGDHALLGYAWSCMTDETRPYRNFYFIKVCDGINTSGRYLDQSLIENDTYVEIYFP